MVSRLFSHPAVASSCEAAGPDGSLQSRPSYIPARHFSMALLDIVKKAPTASDAGPIQIPPSLATLLDTFDKNAAESVDAALEKKRRLIEDWYDATMDRASGWYKRNAQKVMGFAAVVVAIALNVDTFSVARQLLVSSSQRSALVNRAAATLAAPDSAPSFRVLVSQLRDAELPVGWSRAETAGFSGSPWTVLMFVLEKLLGWLVTAAALALGAPFWFDALNKLVNVRSSGPKPKSAAG